MPQLPDVILSGDMTIAQVLAMLYASGHSLSTPHITLDLVPVIIAHFLISLSVYKTVFFKLPSKPIVKASVFTDDEDLSSESLAFAGKSSNTITSSTTTSQAVDPLPSPLQIFSNRGGLSLLALYLPTVYPETLKALLPFVDKERAAPASSEWVKVEANDDIYEDLDDSLTDGICPKIPPINLSVPQHSLAAFGLFLRLPAYSTVLLRDTLKAQCMLRLVLGVTGDGEGSKYIFENVYTLLMLFILFNLIHKLFKTIYINMVKYNLERRMMTNT